MTSTPIPGDPVLRDFPEAFASARLTIRAPRAGDGPMLHAAVLDSLADLRRFPASMPWALAEPSLAASEKYCREGHANFLARRDLPLLLLLRDSGVLVGASGLHRIDWRVPKFEIGYWGRTPYRGRGLIREGVATIAEFAFATLGARRVEVRCDEDNTRACNVCERLDFALEGTLRHERASPDAAPRNTRVYARVR